MLTSDWFDSDFQVKLENDVNILRLTPFYGPLCASLRSLREAFTNDRFKWGLEIYACHGKVEAFKYPLKILIGAAPAGG